MLDSLTTLDLFNSTNFTSDLSVRYFAQILAKAKNLKLVDISWQQANRKINLEVSQVKEWDRYLFDDHQSRTGGIIEEGYGDIIILEKATGNHIYSLEK